MFSLFLRKGKKERRPQQNAVKVRVANIVVQLAEVIVQLVFGIESDAELALLVLGSRSSERGGRGLCT